jgi:hypothetical protein
MLDLFRVRDFAVVQVDETRAQEFRARNFDPGTLLTGETRQALEGGPPQRFASIDAAAAAAGFPLERPEVLPRGLALDTVFVHRGGRASAQIDTRALRELMDTFDVRDLQVPAELDGHSVAIEVPTLVAQAYRRSKSSHAVLVQCASPEVSLPKGVDLARLGEIGLRLIGLDRNEAHRLAGAIDWRSTLVVPVLASATSFQQVEVRGERGLIVQTTRTESPEGARSEPGSAVMWTRAGRVYVLAGNIDRISMLQMAESVR